MLTNILIGLLCYSVFMVLFLIGWRRWCVRMEAYDTAMGQSLQAMRAGQQTPYNKRNSS